MRVFAKSLLVSLLQISISPVPLLFNSTITQAQSSSPPARTYFKDQYGKDTKLVKERWDEDQNGEKHGRYIRYAEGGMYASAGQVMENCTYVHGVKNGPAWYIGDLSFSVRYNANKFVGNYTAGKQTGVWTVYERLNGDKIVEKRLYSSSGELEKVSKYNNGKVASTFSYKNNKLDGPARVYGASETEYASGNCLNNVPVGTWQNAALEEAKSSKSVIYSRGGKVVFENGEPITLISATGAIRSLKAEVAQRDQRQQASRDSAANDERLSLPIQATGIKFYSRSYRLTEESMYLLNGVANAIKEKKGSRYQINTITFSTHTRPLSSGNVEESVIAKRDTADYILCLNRAYSMRAYLRKKLQDDSIKIYSYPCASKLDLGNSDQSRGRNVPFDDEERVQIVFNEDLPNARRQYSTLVSKYALKVQNKVVANDRMKEDIIWDMIALFQDDVNRAALADRHSRINAGEKRTGRIDNSAAMIPAEFWLDSLPSGVPSNYAQAENIKQFREVFIDVLSKLNKKYAMNIEPKVFFTNELLANTK